MVVGHLGEEVVRHVGVCNVVEEVVQEAVGTVHRGQSPTQPVPLLAPIVGQPWVCVLQQRDHHQPEVHNQVRHHVDLQSTPSRIPHHHRNLQ